MFLYILDIIKYDCIKIGIASNISRVESHIRTYENIDLKNSYIINAKDNRTIKQLERQVLNDYFEYKITNKELKYKDGYSELREKKILNDILEDIEYKANKFSKKEIKITKGIEIVKNEKPVYSFNKPTVKNRYFDDENNSINNENIVVELVDLLTRNKDNIIEYSENNGIINGIRVYLNSEDREYLFYQLFRKNFIFCCGISSFLSDLISYKEGETDMYNVNFRLLHDNDEEVRKYFDEIQFRIRKLIKVEQLCGSDIKNDTDKMVRKRLWNF